MATVFAVAVLVVAATGCGGDDPGGGTASEDRPTAYFGYLLGAREFAAVAFDLDEARGDGPRRVRAYVCDGLGPPDGMALWYSGTLDERTTNEVGRSTRLRSAGGEGTLEVGFANRHEIRGVFTDGARRKFRYIAYPATAGAGIYEVTVDEDLRYRGTSTDGSTLEGRTDAQGNLRGTVDPAGEEREIDFFVQNNALASEVRLASLGLSSKSRRYARQSRVPGEYVAVVSPGATHWFGRSGSVKRGSPGASIIGLDKSD